MKADRQSRMWPYVGLLLCLFALSVTAPRAWQRAALRYRQGENSPQSTETTTSSPVHGPASLAVERPVDHQPEQTGMVAAGDARYSEAAPVDVAESETIASPDFGQRTPVRVADSNDRLAMHMPLHREREVRIADSTPTLANPDSNAAQFNQAEASDLEAPIAVETATDLAAPDIAAPAETTDASDPSTGELGPQRHDAVDAQNAEVSSLENPPRELGEPPAASTFVIGDQNAEEEASLPAEQEFSPTNEGGESLAWASPRALLAQLAELEEVLSAQLWVRETRGLIEQLTAQPLLTPEARGTLLADLNSARQRIEQMATAESDWEIKAALLRIQYSLARRLDVWQAIHELGAPPRTQVVAEDQSMPRLARRFSEVSNSTRGSREGEAWRRHVQFDNLQNAMRRAETTPEQRRRLAHQLLGRMAAARTNPQQQAFAESPAVQEFDAALREWSSQEVDLTHLLGDLEEFETNRSPHLARLISEQRQSLVYSSSAIEQAVGERINEHYRNANVRLAISEEFMNRFLPKPQVFDAPVADTIMGASVSGHSRTLNQLKLRLIPDDHKIRLGLEAHGVVHSNTGASSGPVTIYNQGETSYVARKLVLVGNSGMHVWPAVAEATAASDTQSIESVYDAIPVLRSIVRSMAQIQQDEAYGQAMAEVESRVEDTVRRRLDREADPRISKLKHDFEHQLQGPLDRLGLSPTPISLSTTQDRAIIRFRVAGENQLGAHTPRPCAPSDSMASVQLHESVLNNAADQLGLNGQTFALPELHRMVGEKLGLPGTPPEDLPEDAQVTFAAEDAVVIRCDDGKIWVTLSIAELSQGRRKFTNFKATGVYHLVSHGLHTELERDGVVQLAGKRLNLGDQIALRGVISKMFTQNRRPQVIGTEQAADPRLAGLRVTQLVVADGWIGLAIAPDRVVRGKSQSGTSTNR